MAPTKAAGHVLLLQASGLKIDHLDVDFIAPNQVRTRFEGLRNTKITMHFHWRKRHWPHGECICRIARLPAQGAAIMRSSASTIGRAGAPQCEHGNLLHH